MLAVELLDSDNRVVETEVLLAAGIGVVVYWDEILNLDNLVVEILQWGGLVVYQHHWDNLVVEIQKWGNRVVEIQPQDNLVVIQVAGMRDSMKED